LQQGEVYIWKFLSFYLLTLVFTLADDLSVILSCLWIPLTTGDRGSSLALSSTQGN